MNSIKINHQQKNTFIMCKQLNGPVLKSLKPKRSKPRSGRNFNFSFGPTWTEIFIFTLGWSRPRLKSCEPGQARAWKIQPVQTFKAGIIYDRALGDFAQRSKLKGPPNWLRGANICLKTCFKFIWLNILIISNFKTAV